MMLCYDTPSDGNVPDYTYQEGDIFDQLKCAILSTQSRHRSFLKYEECTHIFSHLDTLLPGMRMFHVWSTPNYCEHRGPCEFLDQVYILGNHCVVVSMAKIARVHFRDVIDVLRQKREEDTSSGTSLPSSLSD